MARSAEVLRKSVQPNLSSYAIDIDRGIVLVLDAEGPAFLNEDVVAQSLVHRRVGNTYYSRSFANMVLQETMMNHGRVKPMIQRIAKDQTQRGSMLTSMLVTHVRYWLRILEDVMYSPWVKTLHRNLLLECHSHQEFKELKMDATIRLMRRVKGQEDYRASKAKREDAPFPDSEAWRRVLSVCGRTGAVVGLPLIKNEGSDEISSALGELMDATMRAQVIACSMDNCSQELYQALKELFINLEYMMLDTVHPAITWEHAFFKKSTPGSRCLRVIMHKFNKVDPTVSGSHWGPVFRGSDAPKLSLPDRDLRDSILKQDISKAKCDHVLRKLDGETPWMSVHAFIEALAVLCTRHEKEAERKSHCNGALIKKLMFNLAAPTKVQWYFNNLRYLHSIPIGETALRGSGTGVNESLHGELNKSTRNQPEWFSTTAVLQLNSLAIVKTLAHNCALYNPTLRQITQSMLTARRVATLEVPLEVWKEHCAILYQCDKSAIKPADVPIFRQRQEIARRIKNHIYKRPAAGIKSRSSRIKKPRVVKSMKRTVFTLKRLRVRSAKALREATRRAETDSTPARVTSVDLTEPSDIRGGPCGCALGCLYQQEYRTAYCLYCRFFAEGTHQICGCPCEGCNPDSDARLRTAPQLRRRLRTKTRCEPC